jgi:riboflavin kinase/FMN adenylyltransferase
VGRAREAAEMLGRYFQFSGVVVPGVGRERHVGYPTANLHVEDICALPASGVYAVYVVVQDKSYSAVANIGVRPTFGAGQPVVEVHLLDFHGELGGERIRIQFVERLRDEQRFADVDELRAHIEKDIAQAREILQ